jgi:uncharacterized protein DUF5329
MPAMVKAMIMALIMALNMLQAAIAAPPARAALEIEHLLGLIGQSGCEFFRNGTWYDAQQAQAHLRAKYEMMAANDLIGSAEDFIEKAASSSSVSGRAYQIRCGGTATTTRQWFSSALADYRASVSRSDPCEPRLPRRTQGPCPIASIQSSIVESDREVVMDGSHVFRVAREGYRLLNRLSAPGGAGQPYDAIAVGVDMNTPQAGQVIGGELGLDFRGDCRIFHEYHRARSDRIGVIPGDGRSRAEQRAHGEAGDC